MPISIEEFDDDEEGPPELTTAEAITVFLLSNADKAFTRGEIADAIDRDANTVGTNLSRLKDRQLVRHRGTYWTLTEDIDRVHDAIATSNISQALDAIDGGIVEDEADAAGWARAAPDESHPSTVETDEASDDDDATSRQADDRNRIGHRGEPRDPTDLPHREAASTFFDRVADDLDDRIDALYLFGSVAQGTETATSDVDVLAVVATDADVSAVDDLLLDIAYDVQLEFDVPMEVHTIRAHEFAARTDRGEPFVTAIVEKGERRG